MDDKLKFAAVLLGGYLLGRTKRMKLALTVAGALAFRELRSNPDLLKAGSSLLSSPAVKKLTDEFSGRLVEAGKTAAVAVATKRVDGLVSNLEKRAGARSAAAEHGPEEDEPADVPEESAEPAEESADEETEEPSDEEEAAQEDEEEEPPAKRSKRGSSASGGSRSSRSSAQSSSKQSSSGTRARKSSAGSSARRSGSR